MPMHRAISSLCGEVETRWGPGDFCSSPMPVFKRGRFTYMPGTDPGPLRHRDAGNNSQKFTVFDFQVPCSVRASLAFGRFGTAGSSDGPGRVLGSLYLVSLRGQAS